jgi:hypothetical protein
MAAASEQFAYHMFPNLPTSIFPNDGLAYTYHDLLVAFAWMGCLSRRMHINNVLIHCLSFLDERDPLQQQEEASKSIIEVSGSWICASVPFMLQDIDGSGEATLVKKKKSLEGYMLIWPLHVVRWSTEQGSGKEKWVKAVLEYINMKFGIGSAQLLAMKPRKEAWKLV